MSKKIGIAGAGLVGSLLATYLGKRGHKVEIFERRPDMRKSEIQAGRSINLALSDRGWKALRGVGVEDEVRKLAIPMKGRMLHDENGDLNFMPYGKGDQAIYSVSRGGLNQLLMDHAEASNNVKIHFNERCTDVDLEAAVLHMYNEETGDNSSHKFDYVIGTDGAFSAIRTSMMKTDRFNYSQYYIDHGYKELSIPPGKVDKWQIDKNHLHIWPRKRFMLIALPNLDGSFTVTLFLAFEGDVSFEKLHTEADVQKFFQKYFSDVLPLMPDLLDDFYENPTSSLVTVRCSPWNYKDKVAVMGDASHAIVPFYGQGMNAGFEDCTIFNELLDRHHDDFGAAFKAMSAERVEDANAISELALRNFIEMRDLVADPHFVEKRELSRRINDLMPEQWIPLYSMVTFSHIPYAEALRKGDRQNEILENILKNHDAGTLKDDAQLKGIVEGYLK